MKIVILLPHFGVYGGVRRFFEIGNALTDRVHDVVAYQTDYRHDYDKNWFECNFPRELYPYGEKIKADVVITGDSRRQRAFNEIQAKKKYVYVINTFPEYLEQYKKFKDCEFIVNSLECAKNFPGSQLAIGGVNTDHFRITKDKDWNAKILKVLFFGRFGKEQKQADHILRQLKETTKFLPLEISCFDNDIHKREVTQCQPDQNELVKLYNDHHIFISWEKWGGWANPAAEATACGCLLVTNGTVCPWAVNNKTAVVTDNIIEAIRELDSNRNRMRAIADEGWMEIQKYSWEKVCDKLELIFKQEIIGYPYIL